MPQVQNKEPPPIKLPPPQAGAAIPDLYNAATATAGLPASSRCELSHKAWPECPTPNGTVPLLVTGEATMHESNPASPLWAYVLYPALLSPTFHSGVGRSGTHHTQHALALKGIHVCHEAVCSDGSVSWTYAVVDPQRFYPWEAASSRINGRRFQRIVHQVGGKVENGTHGAGERLAPFATPTASVLGATPAPLYWFADDV